MRAHWRRWRARVVRSCALTSHVGARMPTRKCTHGAQESSREARLADWLRKKRIATTHGRTVLLRRTLCRWRQFATDNADARLRDEVGGQLRVQAKQWLQQFRAERAGDGDGGSASAGDRGAGAGAQPRAGGHPSPPALPASRADRLLHAWDDAPAREARDTPPRPSVAAPHDELSALSGTAALLASGGLRFASARSGGARRYAADELAVPAGVAAQWADADVDALSDTDELPSYA